MIQNCLPRVGSDHVPIRLEVGMHCVNPRQFRFELAWTTVEGFSNLVAQWWARYKAQGCGTFVLAKKLAWLRDELRSWAKENFGSIKLKKLSLLHDLELLDIIKEARCLNVAESQRECVLTENLAIIRRQEELYWKQRSRLQWLKEGDENTKYFHSVANGRKNGNYMPSIIEGNDTFNSARDIGKVFVRRFKDLFGQKRVFRFKVDLRDLLKNKASVDLSFLECPFTLEEVKRAVFDHGSDKAPGPDGFPMHFFKT
ncbi:uncharacterized protein LOC120284106 [Dioscorea cayenensis subsp. rotundata]|uniref:Uncharacterized protein LOC120284106 n=1 Tax=Dioscorea cayennensis subsp. rotundata TaxID=55577 RepID=A0AB40D3J9_DIOCR|nr:uncharacterized protein LOC120284106 [Dioscorea cayenensis subsp. rotundata]